MNIFQKSILLFLFLLASMAVNAQQKFTPKVVVQQSVVIIDLNGMPASDTFRLFDDVGMLVYAGGPNYVGRKHPGHNHYRLLVPDSIAKKVAVEDDANWGLGLEKSLFVGSNSVALQVPSRRVGDYGAISSFAYICTSDGQIDIWHANSGYIDSTSNLQGSHSFALCFDPNAGPEACNSEAGLPVEYSFFEASVFSRDSVVLNWETSQEINSAYFVSERSTDTTSFEVVGLKYAAGMSTTAQSYSISFPDHPIGRYYYRLKQVDQDGTFSYTKTVSVSVQRYGDVTLVQVAGSGSQTPEFFVEEDSDASVLEVGDIWGKKINVSNAAPGVYWVRSGGYATKFVKR